MTQDPEEFRLRRGFGGKSVLQRRHRTLLMLNSDIYKTVWVDVPYDQAPPSIPMRQVIETGKTLGRN